MGGKELGQEKRKVKRKSEPIHLVELLPRSGLLWQTKDADRGADQLLDAGLTIRVADLQGGGSAVAKQGLLLTAKLGEEIATG